MERKGLIRVWHRGLIMAGEDPHATIERQLQAAVIVVILMSHTYNASQDHYEREMVPTLSSTVAPQNQLMELFLPVDEVDARGGPRNELGCLFGDRMGNAAAKR
jgi:hypothetical protein